MLSGSAEPCCGFIPPSVTNSDEGADVLEYDPEKARELLAEAKVTDLSLTAQVRSSDQAVMVAIQNYWSQIGVNLDVQTIDAGLWREERANGALTVTLVTWSTLSFIGVEFMASYFYSSKASQRSSFYSSSAFDGYVDAARTTLNEDEAKEDTIAADRQLVRTDFATIPVVWPKTPLCPARRLRWPLGPRELPLQGHVQERLELNERHIASRLHSSLSESCSIAESSFRRGWNCYMMGLEAWKSI